MTTPARTIFLGSGEFAIPVAAALARQPGIDLLAVVTAPPRRGARGRLTDPPLAGWADEHGLPMFRPVRLRAAESVAELRRLRPELLVLADYGQIVPATLLELPRHGALNLHPSLLPRHRGAAPIPAAILAGDAETGVSLMQMDAGLDSGPIVAQRRCTLAGDETGPELEQRLAEMAAVLLADTLEAWLAGLIEPQPQAETGVTLTRPLRREDGRLDPARGVAYLERHVRAFQPWPGSFVDTAHGRVVVWQAQPAVADSSGGSGRLVARPGGGLALVASDGLLELTEVQPAGGRRMGGADLLRGHPALVGATLIDASSAGRPACG